MSLSRVPVTLAAALAFHVSMSPPSTSGSGDSRLVCAAPRVVTALLTKGLFWASALSDTLVVLAPYVPTSLPAPPHLSVPPTGTLLAWATHPTQFALSLPTYLPPLSSIPLVAITGTTLALAGAYLRHAAYDALGQFYACPNRGSGPCVPPRGRSRGHAHALITTGPYAFVRHPGYAGLALCTAGLIVLQLDALRLRAVGVSLGMRAMALVCALLATVGAVRRIRDEERALRERFQGEWEAWAKTVPYKLVPGVY